MESEVQQLKAKVMPMQLRKAKERLKSETELSKKKTLELRKEFDLQKSKNALKSLQLKKQLEDRMKYLNDSKCTWKSDLMNLRNSVEIFQVSEVKKKMFKERVYEQLVELIARLQVNNDNQADKENYWKRVAGVGLDLSSNCSESTLNQTLIKTVDSIKERLKNMSSVSESNTLMAVEERIELSIDTNLDFSDEQVSSCSSQDPKSPTQLTDRLQKAKYFYTQSSDSNRTPDRRSNIDSSRKSSVSNHSLGQCESVRSEIPTKRSQANNLATEQVNISLQPSPEKQPKTAYENEMNDTIINLAYDQNQILSTIAIPTQGDPLNNTSKGASYLISEGESMERTQEIKVKSKNWKTWLCPCIFKKF